MKELIQHVDYVKFKAKKPTKLAVKLSEKERKGLFKEGLFVRFAAEEEDNSHSTEVAEKAVEDLKKIAEQLKTKNILLYPYVHLLYGAQPSKSDVALKIMDVMEEKLKASKFKVQRAPFGWYKEFEMKCKGHPLSEWSRIIRAEDVLEEKEGEQEISEALKAEKKLKSKFYILEPNGKKHEISIKKGKIKGFNFSKYKKLEKLCLYEMAKNRVMDKAPPHIELMKKLELVSYEEGSDPGNLRFMPNGRLIKGLLEEYVTKRTIDYGAMEVETPIMYDYDHPTLKKYLDRFPARQYVVKTPNKNCFLRFAACFGSFLMARDATISYRNLPLGIYEMTRYSFRAEKRGELAGLRRLRAFTMPDYHTLCVDIPQAVEEMKKRYKLAKELQDGFELMNNIELSIRCVKEYEKELKPIFEFLRKEWKKPIFVEEWDKRFFYYIFKHEWNFIDALGKAACLTTDQIDVENAETYDLNYVGEDGKEHPVVILHLSPSGSIERVMYALLEKAYMQERSGVKPMLPLWLSPTQVRIANVADRHLKACEKLAKQLEKECIRVDIDDRSETISKKTSDSEQEWVPIFLVVGDKELKSEKLSVRLRKSGKIKQMTLDELIKMIKERVKDKPFQRLSLPKLVSKRPKFVG